MEMDDSCAVCAEALEWVAYGACGHRDVCSTCVARLRFICNDSHCCICKTENAVVFVTKALGDYTRQHPGQYEYFKNYDDLEIHFRHEHFLCEDEGCLAKKFIVFQSEAEMKRHNALEHGGRMSRSKRNVALQIPTSFQYSRSIEQDRRRRRGRTIRQDFAEDQISAAMQASLEYANADSNHSGGSSSSAQIMPNPAAETDDIDPIVQPFESLTTAESEQPSRYLRALGQSYGNASLREAAFPTLMDSSSSNQIPKRDSEVLGNTMADHLRHQNNNRNLNVARKWNATGHRTTSSTITSLSTTNAAAASAPVGSRSASSSCASLTKGQALGEGGAAAALRFKSASPLRSSDGTGRIIHSSSAPNLAEKELVESSTSDFPPISAAVPKRKETSPKVEDVQAADKSLVEKIRAALDNDQEKYTSFKEISALYRQGSIDTEMYLNYVKHFGLSHLILNLAKLCPDPGKQKELVETYNSGVRKNDIQENGWDHDSSTSSKKGKGKQVDALANNRNTLTDSFMGTVRDLQSNNQLAEEEVEVLTKYEYQMKGKSKATSDDE